MSGCSTQLPKKLGMDRVELRRRNLIGKAEMPFARQMDVLGEQVSYDSGDYELLLDKALAVMEWDALQTKLKGRRAAGELIGAGVSVSIEESGYGPADGVKITVDTTGAVELVTGSASVGQGVETVLAQICADALGVDYRRVRVIHGRTDLIAHGVGAHASRATVMTGSATHVAAGKVRAKAIEFAAELMQSRADELEIVDGIVSPARTCLPDAHWVSARSQRTSLRIPKPSVNASRGFAPRAGSAPNI